MADLLLSFWSPVGKPNIILHYITLYNHHFWSVDVYGLFCGDFSKITISRYIISSGFHSSPPIDKVDKVRFPILVGGFKHFLFSIIYGIILPINELIFFRGVGIPPTSNASVVCSTFLHRFFGFSAPSDFIKHANRASPNDKPPWRPGICQKSPLNPG